MRWRDCSLLCRLSVYAVRSMVVAGGAGELMGALAKQYPGIQGTVFDLPGCSSAANQHFATLGISDRVGFVAGDFFHGMPAIADGIILKSIIHDWDDHRSKII